ncbi:hypothetical protein DAPPUDRAFT_340634 [Daphnia pulex]|uniref:Uncharacterized protein n=1 Tax=Daphnia pulex TaxID=6669 RepID=E9I4H1_DAPPU|nr:hypothetical protein DAPPUDRAFT_340634 [Daphnia pulex]|eukprot:EFX61108.1 hypothetical protein DAPPUDRAFT_340634 [Daphnia pulex]
MIFIARDKSKLTNNKPLSLIARTKVQEIEWQEATVALAKKATASNALGAYLKVYISGRRKVGME